MFRSQTHAARQPVLSPHRMASRGLERRLLRAAAAGETDAVENLLRDGADPGCQVRTFNSHLHLVYFFSNKKKSHVLPAVFSHRTGSEGSHPADVRVRARERRHRSQPSRRWSPVVRDVLYRFDRLLPSRNQAPLPRRLFFFPPQERAGQRRSLCGGVGLCQR